MAARKKIGSDLFDPIERPLYGAPNSTGSIEFGELPPRDLSPPVFAPPCAACQFFLPFRLLLACPVAFKFPLLGWPTLITIREERQAAFDKRMPILKADGIDLLRDRAGVIRYSDVEVQFPYALLRDTRVAALVGFAVVEEPPDRTTEWLESLHPDVNKVSIFAVNRLLRAYRFLSGEHWVRSIGATDIFYIQTGWLFPDAPSPFAMTLGTPGQSIVPEARPLSDRFHGELARWLGAERDVPIWVELVQDAREHLEVGRLRHVVIDTRTALEVYVDQTLLACFRQRALSPRDAAKELKLSKMSAQSASSLEEAIRLASINDKLKRGVKKALGIELGRLKVWGDWLAAKDVREGSVHYGQDVSETDARRCLEVVEALINAIHEAGSPVSAALKPATSS